MKKFILSLAILLALATCVLAQKTFTVWDHGKATIYQVSPNGQVTGITPGQPGMIVGDVSNGNATLYDMRQPAPDPVNPSPYVGGSPWVGGSPFVK